MIDWFFNTVPCVAIPVLIIIGLLYLARNDIREVLISWGIVEEYDFRETSTKKVYTKRK